MIRKNDNKKGNDPSKHSEPCLHAKRLSLLKDDVYLLGFGTGFGVAVIIMKFLVIIGYFQ